MPFCVCVPKCVSVQTNDSALYDGDNLRKSLQCNPAGLPQRWESVLATLPLFLCVFSNVRDVYMCVLVLVCGERR